ncbi:hypothetical protein N7456_002528 [Penicillium angulare]|uniref:Xylanolytic transcriptional activator regulatory domain-containing protein n=1 Tax=Penicillium angulare TaxID=116970 RepID=A0A9W9G891_9EURO|nr:hypothetical protein N7456_002528 [Penicillium angulare]
MEVVWQASPGEPRRKRASKACDDCQRRKKRCDHLNSSSKNFQPHPNQLPSNSTAPSDWDYLANHGTTTAGLCSSRQSPEPSRVGDYHPESILTELSASPAELNAQRQPADDAPNPITSHSNIKSLRQNQRWQYDSMRLTSVPISSHLKAYLAETGAFRTLPRSTQDGLVTTYITSIDCLVPILDGSDVLRKYSNQKLSPLLINAMCLLACKAGPAAPYLRLTEKGSLLKPPEFAKTLYNGLDVAMRMDLEQDRLVRIQILALMSQYHDGCGAVREASARLSQAIHDSWVLTLHYDIPVHRDQTQCRYIWWTLRALDRLNACLHGCPPMISDKDTQTPSPLPGQGYRSDVALITYRMGDLQDDVIETYRPNSEKLGKSSLQDFPSLRDIAREVDLEEFPESHRSYLELWYLVMALLYCRHGKVGTPEYKLRVDSASRIQDLTCIEKHALLPPLPLITFAVSMSLAVAYQARGDDPSIAQQADVDLQARFKILQTLGKNDWKARQMARLAKKVIPSLKGLDHTNQVSIHHSHLPIFNESQHSSPHMSRTAFNDADLPSPGNEVQHSTNQIDEISTESHTAPVAEKFLDDIQFEISYDDTEIQFPAFDQYMAEVFTMSDHIIPV